MRGPINEAGPGALGLPHRLAPITPAVYQEDPVFVLWCEALDELLGPIAAALDCFPAYLDPRLAPADFLGWLGGLVGLDPAELRAPADRLPELVADAVAAHDRRGTPAGVREAVARAARVPVEQVELEEPGGVVWARVAGAAAVPAAGGTVRVRVRASNAVDGAEVMAAARAAVPVQYQVRIEMVVES
ncbi:phage tail protein [Kitasatospora sp. NPDC049285]|uniref:phage tail protein n=1 Tax=Kitasatospora sp. NPDC049285 TaxID=3157096 RepID=UPI003439EA80